jgi:hypothetical protein
MPIYKLTVEQHQNVLKRLIGLCRSIGNIKTHSAGLEYTSIMSCFLLHNLSSAESLLHLLKSFTNEWFPITIGYTIVRPMFEIDVNAHYITKNPTLYSRQYIEFESVIKYNQMNAIQRHKNSNNESWNEGLNHLWNEYWQNESKNIESKFLKVKSTYSKITKKGTYQVFSSWSGKSIRQMSVEVDHEEAYDVFYSELSSFTHGNVTLANRFLRIKSEGLLWTMKANEFDVGNIFRYAATFFTCFLELFGEQFGTWNVSDVESCWKY